MTDALKRTDVCIFIPSFGSGGAERMMVNLARGISEKGFRIDFVVGSADGPFLASLPAEIAVTELYEDGVRRYRNHLKRYMESAQPRIVLCTKNYGEEILRLPKSIRSASRIFVRLWTSTSNQAAHQNFIKRFQTYRKMRQFLPRAYRLVAVSEGVAEDASNIARIPVAEITVLPNPVITPEFIQLVNIEPSHPWLVKKTVPVILGAGGFRRSKDFGTLIRAFAKARQKRKLRLIIIGEGRQRKRLVDLAWTLGVHDDLDLPGFVTNPYSFMKCADLFVLSSLWEGSPNVLAEALAAGTPVVSTDCPSGPKEMLKKGRFGPLVTPGDPVEMADAILTVLANPIDAGTLRRAAQKYNMTDSATAYLRSFGLLADS